MSAREIIAREVSAGCNTVDWERGRTDSEDVADAILSALRSAGWAVVPVEPTDEMYFAFYGPSSPSGEGVRPLWKRRYKAMLLKAAQEDSRELPDTH